MELLTKEKSVRTREDLASFVRALASDLAANGESWGNPELGRFLESLSAWIMDMPGYFRNQGTEPPEEPTWNLVATMLHAAKIYE
jgi:hypothetical protein